MKLSELIAKYGDEGVKFQNLDTDMVSMNKKKNNNELTFGTPETFNLEGTVKMGLVVWMERDKVEKILKDKS